MHFLGVTVIYLCMVLFIINIVSIQHFYAISHKLHQELWMENQLMTFWLWFLLTVVCHLSVPANVALALVTKPLALLDML